MKCVWPPPVRLMTRPPLNPIDGQSIILLAPSCARNGQGDDGSGRSGLKVTKTERPRFPSCVTSLPHRFPPREAESRRSSSVRSLVQKPASPASGGRRTHQSPGASLSERQGIRGSIQLFLTAVAPTQDAGAIRCAAACFATLWCHAVWTRGMLDRTP